MHGKFRVRRDRIIIIDLEMTCWNGQPPADQQSEIIEIGIVEVDVPSLSILRGKSYWIKPEFSEVSPFCTQLTGITPNFLKKNGKPLQEVFNALKKEWGTGSKAWFSWGSDKQSVLRDCHLKNANSPFSESFHDIGQQFTLLMGSSAAIGLTSAMYMFGLDREGQAHNGLNDAKDTARLWIAMAGNIKNAFESNAEYNVQSSPAHKF